MLNNYINRIHTDYECEYFFYDASQTSHCEFSFAQRLPSTNTAYKIYGNQGLIQYDNLQSHDNVRATELKFGTSNTSVIISGRIITTDDVVSYSSIVTNISNNPINDVNYSLFGVTDDGEIYSFYIDNGTLKNRKTIPNNTSIRFGTEYK